MALIERLFGDQGVSTYHRRYAFRQESRIVETGDGFVVLKAYDLDQEGPVTLKVYDLQGIQDDVRELARTLWESEVRILMQLVPYQRRAPGLVRFVEGDWDQVTETLFVAWEDAYRLTLADILKEPTRGHRHLEELSTRVDLLVMLAEALYELHGLGIIHREITPQAICLWDEQPSRAALTHFGMSIFLNNFLWAPTPDAFRKGETAVSSLRYAAPERLAFLASTRDMIEAGEDYRQDFFSLGLAMVEWFTRPFEPRDAERFLPSDGGYDEYAHSEWLLIDVADRINHEQLSNDRAAEAALKDLLRRMVEFSPSERFSTAGQFVKAARDVQALFRRRAYLALCRKPFKVVFSASECAMNLDLMDPRESPRALLPYEKQIRSIQTELQQDLAPGVQIRIGLDRSRRWAVDAGGRRRWLLRGQRHLYRLEIFRSKRDADTPCPWIAHVYQVVRGSVVDDMTLVPFTAVKVIPLQESNQHTNRGQPPSDIGRWDELVEHIQSTEATAAAEMDFANRVLIQSLQEIVGLQDAAADLETYQFMVVATKEPQGPLGTLFVTFRYAPEADLEFVAQHPYIRFFEKTRDRRPAVASWLQRLQRDVGVAFDVAGDLKQLRVHQRRIVAILEAVDIERRELRLRLPPGSPPCPTLAFLRKSRDDEHIVARQRDAIDALEADRYRIDLLREPGHANVTLPDLQLSWRTLPDGVEPDKNKSEILRACLRAYPLFVLQGPPGTGKTTTATELVAQILKQNPAARILVSAQANDALDNLLESIVKTLPDRNRYLLIREPSGRPRAVNPVVAQLMPLRSLDEFFRRAKGKGKAYLTYLQQAAPERASRVQPIYETWCALLDRRHSEFERFLYQSANIIFATCLGVPRLDRRDLDHFSWVIVEEAARAHPTELLIPFLRGHRYLLIGDHLQLEPFKADIYAVAFRTRVRERIEKLKELASESERMFDTTQQLELERADRYLAPFSHLFSHTLSMQHDTLIACYRMHPVLCELVDRLFYRKIDDTGMPTNEPVLIPATTRESRAHRLRASWGADDWLHEKSLIWLDTTTYAPQLRREQTLHGDTSKFNSLEVDIASALVSRIRAQDRDKSILLLTIYQLQRERLDRIAKDHHNVRSLTVMGAQGKEAAVVILSLVRSNTHENPGSAYGDIRRDSFLNVAVSRAKELLLIIGDLQHFRTFGQDAGRIPALAELVTNWPNAGDASHVGVHRPTDLVVGPSEPRGGR